MVQLQEPINLFKFVFHEFGSHSLALLAAWQVLEQVADDAECLLLLLAAQTLLSPMPLDLQCQDVDASGVSKQLMCWLLYSPGRSMHYAPLWMPGRPKMWQSTMHSANLTIRQSCSHHVLNSC